MPQPSPLRSSEHRLLARLARNLDRLDREDLLRTRRTVEPVDGVRLRVDDTCLLSFCSNDYLGLSGDTRIVEAACAGARAGGAG